MKNADGHPLVLYLKKEKDQNLTETCRQLLEKINTADKTAKIKVFIFILRFKKGYEGKRQG